MHSLKNNEFQPTPPEPSRFELQEMIFQWEEEIGVPRERVMKAISSYENDPAYQASFFVADDGAVEISSELAESIARDLRKGRLHKVPKEEGAESFKAEDEESNSLDTGRPKASRFSGNGVEVEKTIIEYKQDKRTEEKQKNQEWVTVDTIVNEVMQAVPLPREKILQLFGGFYRTRKDDFDIRYLGKGNGHHKKPGSFMMCPPEVAEELRSYFRALLSIE